MREGCGMNGQCSGRNCEIAATCRRFNPRIHAEAICGFGGDENGPAVHWVERIRVVVPRAA